MSPIGRLTFQVSVFALNLLNETNILSLKEWISRKEKKTKNSSAVFSVVIYYLAILGTLRFGQVDVTEAQFGIIGLHLLTFLFGGSIWQQHVRIASFSPHYLILEKISQLEKLVDKTVVAVFKNCPHLFVVQIDK